MIIPGPPPPGPPICRTQIGTTAGRGGGSSNCCHTPSSLLGWVGRHKNSISHFSKVLILGDFLGKMPNFHEKYAYFRGNLPFLIFPRERFFARAQGGYCTIVYRDQVIARWSAHGRYCWRKNDQKNTLKKNLKRVGSGSECGPAKMTIFFSIFQQNSIFRAFQPYILMIYNFLTATGVMQPVAYLGAVTPLEVYMSLSTVIVPLLVFRTQK